MLVCYTLVADFFGALDACSRPPDSSRMPSRPKKCVLVDELFCCISPLQPPLFASYRVRTHVSTASHCLLITKRSPQSHCTKFWRRGARAAQVWATVDRLRVEGFIRRRRDTLMPMDAHEHCRAAALELWQGDGTSTHRCRPVGRRGRRADEGPSGHLVACPPHGKLPTRHSVATHTTARKR